MPAVRYRLYICPEIDGQPARVFDLPRWWDRSELYAQYGRREIEIPTIAYDDSAILLTSGEAAALDERGREAFAGDPRASEPFFAGEMTRVQAALRDAKWVIVEAYEWESGLD